MKIFTLLSLIVAALFMGAAAAYAQQQDLAAGGAEVQLLKDVLTGNLGFAFGLTLTIVGLFVIIRGNFAGGVTLIILGVLITLTPSVYHMVTSFTCPLAEALGGHCGETG